MSNAFDSITLTTAYSRYSTIEKECLDCKTFAKYLVGLKTFKLLTDHKPLILLSY